MSDVSKINVTKSKTDFHYSIPSNGTQNLNLGTSSVYSGTETFDVDQFLTQSKSFFEDLNISKDIQQGIENTGASISKGYQSLLDVLDHEVDKVDNEQIENILHTLVDGAREIPEVYQRTKATVQEFFISITEGILKFGESLSDFFINVMTTVATPFTLLVDGFSSASDYLFDTDFNSSVTNDMWNQTKTFVSKDHVGGWFDNFYENTDVGKWIKSNAYAFDTIRSFGTGIGEIVGIVGLTFLTGGAGGTVLEGISNAEIMSIISGASGMGKGTEKSWRDGATIQEGLTYGTLNGIWNAIQFYVGGNIGGVSNKLSGKIVSETASTLKSKGVNLLTKMSLSGVNGGVNNTVSSLLKTTYKYDSYGEALKKEGGFKSIATQAFSAASCVFIGDVLQFGGKTNSEINNVTNEVTETVENMNNVVNESVPGMTNNNSSQNLSSISNEQNPTFTDEVIGKTKSKTISKTVEEVLPSATDENNEDHHKSPKKWRPTYR